MIDGLLGHRKARPPVAAPMTLRQADAIIARVQQLVEGVSCLTGNVAGMACQVNLRLAEGTLTETQANDLLNRLHNAHAEIEKVCRDYSHARDLLTLQPAAPDPVH